MDSETGQTNPLITQIFSPQITQIFTDYFFNTENVDIVVLVIVQQITE
jgi:hypothetical protein